METIKRMANEIRQEFGENSREYAKALNIALRAGRRVTNTRAVVLLCEVIADGRFAAEHEARARSAKAR